MFESLSSRHTYRQQKGRTQIRYAYSMLMKEVELYGISRMHTSGYDLAVSFHSHGRLRCNPQEIVLGRLGVA